MQDEIKDTKEGAGAQAVSQIEKALLRREIDKWLKTINPALVAVCKAVPRFTLEGKDAQAFAGVVARSIARGVMYQGRYESGDAEITANEVLDAMSEDTKRALTANLVTGFLDRVNEIEDIAEAAYRGGGAQ